MFRKQDGPGFHNRRARRARRARGDKEFYRLRVQQARFLEATYTSRFSFDE